jgi:hypothetical protein
MAAGPRQRNGRAVSVATRSTEMLAMVTPPASAGLPKWALRGLCPSARTRLIAPAARRIVLKMKNSDAPAVKREAEEDWGQGAVAVTVAIEKKPLRHL